MKRLLLSVLLLGALVIQPALSGAFEQGDEVHAAIVDIPDVIDMSHASPETWQALPPPKEPYDEFPMFVPNPDVAPAITFLYRR